MKHLIAVYSCRTLLIESLHVSASLSDEEVASQYHKNGRTDLLNHSITVDENLHHSSIIGTKIDIYRPDVKKVLTNQRLKWIATTLNDINHKYAWLIENDYLCNQDIRLNYFTLMDKNRDYLDAILRSIGEVELSNQCLRSNALTPALFQENTEDDKDELDLMMKIEISLCEIDDMYQHIIDQNLNATEELKAFYQPHRRNHIGLIKFCRRLIYSYY